MKKREGFFLFVFIFLLAFSLSAVHAQEQNTTSEQETTLEESSVEFEEGVILETSEGTTPDSALYVFDDFFDRFGDRIEVREEKVAEIRAMVEAGKIEEARIALEKYREHAEALEREVSPEDRERAKRSASAIYNTLKDIESQIPDDEREDFVERVADRERSIITSAEIASKIKELCESLSKIDPLEYSRVCKTDDGAPEWQKQLDEDLTAEQRAEAEKFGRIMSECFRTSGQQCRCSEIPFTEFANVCSIAAPLAVACEIEGNEAACEKLNDLEMPELPLHLQSVFDNLERDISDAQFEFHMPRECVKAGATSPRECMKIMIETNAPEECRQALIDANVQSERKAREICEKIMFEQNAPQECIDAGLKNPRECGQLMFKLNAPQECIDAGLTGENKNDPRKCEEIMKGLNRQGLNRGHEGGFGFNCRAIQNPEERLRCYDGAIGQTQNFDERFRETKEAERQCAQSCLSRGGAWDFSNGNCQCHFPERFDDSQFREEFSSSGEFRDGFVPPEEFAGTSPEESCARAGGAWDGSTCKFPESQQQQDTTTATDSSTTGSGVTESTTTESTTSDTGSTPTGASIREFNERNLVAGEGYRFCLYLSLIHI